MLLTIDEAKLGNLRQFLTMYSFYADSDGQKKQDDHHKPAIGRERL
jgi:hypothetical protein